MSTAVPPGKQQVLTPNCAHSTEDVALSRLEDDCKLLQTLLDEALKIEVGEELFAKVRHPWAQRVVPAGYNWVTFRG